MSGETSTVMRARALAQSGTCRDLFEVRMALRREGCTAVELMEITPTLALQLTKLCVQARSKT